MHQAASISQAILFSTLLFPFYFAQISLISDHFLFLRESCIIHDALFAYAFCLRIYKNIYLFNITIQ